MCFNVAALAYECVHCITDSSTTPAPSASSSKSHYAAIAQPLRSYFTAMAQWSRRNCKAIVWRLHKAFAAILNQLHGNCNTIA
jgi:hypothetical protein